ncbi:hypothetical protein AALB53_18835, partial [Lachnospiraceae bacterium 47-T17]
YVNHPNFQDASIQVICVRSGFRTVCPKMLESLFFRWTACKLAPVIPTRTAKTAEESNVFQFHFFIAIRAQRAFLPL